MIKHFMQVSLNLSIIYAANILSYNIFDKTCRNTVAVCCNVSGHAEDCITASSGGSCQPDFRFIIITIRKCYYRFWQDT